MTNQTTVANAAAAHREEDPAGRREHGADQRRDPALRPRTRCRTPSPSVSADDGDRRSVDEHARPRGVADVEQVVVAEDLVGAAVQPVAPGRVASRTATVTAAAARAAAATRIRPEPALAVVSVSVVAGEVVVMRASRAVDGRWLDARNAAGRADRGGLGDRAPCWHGAAEPPFVPTVLPCPGHAAPPSGARCWPPCTWSSRSASWPPHRTARRGSPSRSACSSCPRRPRCRCWWPGAGTAPWSGVLLGLLSLAVAHVVAKEVWLQWLAATDDPGRWAWLVAGHRRERVVGPRDVRAAAAALPGRPGAVAALARGCPATWWPPRRHPGRRGGRGRAVPGAPGRPRPPVRPAPGLVGGCSRWSRSCCCSC